MENVDARVQLSFDGTNARLGCLALPLDEAEALKAVVIFVVVVL